jgi:predicted type IV restriction endonuclease
MATVPARIASRIVEGLKQFQPIVEAAKKRDINESDTVVLMTGIISEMLGFDKYADITTEVQVKSTFCDLGLKIDNKIRILIEAKAIGVELRDKQIRQAIDYAANKGLEWVILSNAVKWQIYKVIFSKPIDHTLVCEIDFLQLNPKSQEDIEKLYVLTKEAISKSILDDFYAQKQATSKFLIGNLLTADSIMQSLKKELRQIYPDIKIPVEEIKMVLFSEVIKRDLLEGEEAEEAKRKIARALRKMEKLNQKDDDPNSSQIMAQKVI